MATGDDRPGWYEDDEGAERWWDGDQWTDDVRTEAPAAEKKTRRQWSATDHLFYGFLASAIGAGLLVGGLDASNDALTLVGSVLVTFGYIALMIGIIAKGVTVGMRDHD